MRTKHGTARGMPYLMLELLATEIRCLFEGGLQVVELLLQRVQQRESVGDAVGCATSGTSGTAHVQASTRFI
jgi:hypothetical protein